MKEDSVKKTAGPLQGQDGRVAHEHRRRHPPMGAPDGGPREGTPVPDTTGHVTLAEEETKGQDTPALGGVVPCPPPLSEEDLLVNAASLTQREDAILPPLGCRVHPRLTELLERVVLPALLERSLAERSTERPPATCVECPPCAVPATRDTPAISAGDLDRGPDRRRPRLCPAAWVDRPERSRLHRCGDFWS